jgi:hypothetical protein
VTWTTVLIALPPPVGVATTVIVVAPFGVDLEVEPELLFVVQPVKMVAARNKVARLAVYTMRRRGVICDATKPQKNSAVRAAQMPTIPIGKTGSRGWIGGIAALVMNVNWTVVPVGGAAGVTGFGVKVPQDEFAGRLEQLSV